MSNAAQVAAELEMFALKKWVTTELYVRQFSNQAQNQSRMLAPGPDTGNLDRSIKYTERSLGVFNLEVTSEIEPNANPDTGITADIYGRHQNDGHYSIFLRRSVPPILFMETGGEEMMVELMGKLSGIWSGV
jgi:hypothetical protein